MYSINHIDPYSCKPASVIFTRWISKHCWLLSFLPSSLGGLNCGILASGGHIFRIVGINIPYNGSIMFYHPTHGVCFRS